MKWQQNRDFIISQVESGQATRGQQDWYDRYMASGAPVGKAGMLSKTEYIKQQADQRMQLSDGRKRGGGFEQQGLASDTDIFNQAVDSGEQLVKKGGGERFLVADIGLGTTDTYLNALTDAGLLPESPTGEWEYHRKKDGMLSISPLEPDKNNTILEDYGVPALGVALTAATGGALGPIASGALGGAVSGIANGSEAILDGALRGGVTGAISGGGLGEALAGTEIAGLDQFGDLYNAPNFAGSFTQNLTNDVLTNAILTGDVDLEQSLTNAGIGMGIDTLGDVVSDSWRTSNYPEAINGKSLLTDPEGYLQELDNIRNSSDVFGLLGENGALSQITGVDIGRLPTGLIADALNGVDDLSGGNLEGIFNNLMGDRYAYEEDFFDVTSDRVFDMAGPEGIYTENPYSVGSSSSTGGSIVSGSSGTGGEGGLPGFQTSYGSGPFSSREDNNRNSTSSNVNSTPITDSMFEEGRLPEDSDLMGTTDPFEQELTVGGGTDYGTLFGGSIGEDTLPSGGESNTLPAGPDSPPVSPDITPQDDDLPEQKKELPPSGGGGGSSSNNRRRQALKLLNEAEEKKYRLARIMSSTGLSDNLRKMFNTEIQGLLETASEMVGGDLTGLIDSESKEYIEGYVEDQEYRDRKKKNEGMFARGRSQK